jgi:hypothetical protein
LNNKVFNQVKKFLVSPSYIKLNLRFPTVIITAKDFLKYERQLISLVSNLYLFTIFSPGAICIGGTQTLYLGMMRRVFYHCAIATGQGKVICPQPVAQHLSHHPEVEGLSPTPADNTWRRNSKKVNIFLNKLP